MPTYTYVREQCQTCFEAFASIQKKESGWKPNCSHMKPCRCPKSCCWCMGKCTLWEARPPPLRLLF